LNAGVPGYGLGQYYLQLRSLGRLSSGTLVIMHVNPVNDLANLSTEIDYSSPKPYALMRGNRVHFRYPTIYHPKCSFYFSSDFSTLHQYFPAKPTPPTFLERSTRYSSFLYLLRGLLNQRQRLRWADEQQLILVKHKEGPEAFRKRAFGMINRWIAEVNPISPH